MFAKEVFIHSFLRRKKISLGVIDMMNHSLDPNVAYAFRDGNAILYALRDIKEGEELSVSYGGQTNLDFSRYEFLSWILNF